MKQYMKRVLLVLSMVVSLFALSACSNKNAAEAETMDPQTASYISQISENLLQTIAEMDEATAEESETGLLKQGEDGLASGLTSWIGVMKDTGAFVSVLSSDTELGEDDQYVCVIQAQFEKRNVEFKAFYTMDPQSQNLNPVSLTFSPEYTVGENMAKAGMNTLLGMGTVFLVLIFISILISCFKFISVFENKMKAKNAAPAPAAAPAAPAGAAGAVAVTAPMPGKILAVKANAGQAVKKGDVIMVLEAMKMENDIVAPQDGTVASINAAAGDAVEAGATLATLN